MALRPNASAPSYLTPANATIAPIRAPPPIPSTGSLPSLQVAADSPIDIYYQSRSAPFPGFEQKFRMLFGRSVQVWRGSLGRILYCFQNHHIDQTILEGLLLTVSYAKIFLIDVASGMPPQQQSTNYNFQLNPVVLFPRVTFYYNASSMEFYSHGMDPFFDEKRTCMLNFFNANLPSSSTMPSPAAVLFPAAVPSPFAGPSSSAFPSATSLPPPPPPPPHGPPLPTKDEMENVKHDLEKVKDDLKNANAKLEKASTELSEEKRRHDETKKILDEIIEDRNVSESALKRKLSEIEKKLEEANAALDAKTAELAEKDKKIAEVTAKKTEAEERIVDLTSKLNESAMKILELTKQVEVKPGPSDEHMKGDVIPLRVYSLNSRNLNIENRLGGGGEGEVYKITLTFAVKQLRNAKEFLNTNRNFIHADLDIPLRCSHPHILNVFGYGIADDSHLYILQSLKDFSLDKILNAEIHSMFTLGSLVDFALQILDGLNYLHGVGFFHGDMKLQNVLVEETYRGLSLVLSDFGKSKEYDDVIKTMTERSAFNAMATYSYTSPEVLEGKKGPPADVYAFGLMLWEIYVGRTVNFGSNPAQICYKILNPKELFESMLREIHNDTIRTLIGQCLQTDPALRPKAAEAMQVLEALELRSEPPAVPEPFASKRKPLTSYIMMKEKRPEVVAANVDP